VNVPDHFGLFGLPERFAIDLQALERRYLELSREHHPDRHATKSSSDRLVAVQRTTDVNAAYKVLRDEFHRAEHLLRRRGIETSEAAAQDHRATVDSSLLMEVMELREALSDARGENDVARVATLATHVRLKQEATWAEIRESFSQLDAGNEQALPAIANALTKIRYYRRFLDEVSAIEDAE
jgi:molecular chaperone HscB